MKMCPRCKNDALEAGMIRVSQEYNGHFYIIENVSAYTCAQCGEIILSESVAEKMQRIIWSDAKPERTEAVPVYEVA